MHRRERVCAASACAPRARQQTQIAGLQENVSHPAELALQQSPGLGTQHPPLLEQQPLACSTGAAVSAKPETSMTTAIIRESVFIYLYLLSQDRFERR